jgi:hypothetical protein
LLDNAGIFDPALWRVMFAQENVATASRGVSGQGRADPLSLILIDDRARDLRLPGPYDDVA